MFTMKHLQVAYNEETQDRVLLTFGRTKPERLTKRIFGDYFGKDAKNTNVLVY